MKRLFALTYVLLLPFLVVAQDINTLYKDIEEVEITASLKHDDYRRAPISSTTMTMLRLEERGVTSAKELSLLSPNFYQPDYGSSITSSIYVRGFGSRIDQPVLGMIIDDVPVMNKNAFDFDFYDIRRIELLRGPQGTLYGRNTSGGVMHLTTLSPLTWQGFRGVVEYSTPASYRVSGAYYTMPTDNFGISLAAGYNRYSGHYLNTYTGDICDDGNSASARLRLQWLSGVWSFDNTLSVGYTNEGGYAYHQYNSENNSYNPVCYNDPSGYERLTINEGFVAKYSGHKIKLSSVTSYQYLDDCMTLDQDFSTRSMFTMQQMQREHSITEDIVIRNTTNANTQWQWLTGLFMFAKWLDMSSPVTFKQDGINELILNNINNGLHSVFPDNNMIFGVDNFVIASDFDIPTYGAALYHQSEWHLGRWKLIAGLRFDWEYATMDYNSNATIPYMFDLTMSDYKELRTEFTGRESQMFFKVLPKIAAQYNLQNGSIYATVTRGYKAGGFNIQIFSDILQNKVKSALMNDAMSAMGRPSTGEESSPYDAASVTTYDPEYSWNYELGGHLQFADGRVGVDFAAFWIECRDQQLTVFPEGTTTGRMMSNAGHSRSRGVELSATWDVLKLSNLSHLRLMANYGYTNAKFMEFIDGLKDYAGKHLPYAPQHTASLGAAYNMWIGGRVLDEVVFNASMQGAGKIYWNEENTLSQNFYSQLNASVELRKGDFSLSLWGRNLTNTDFYTFYFKSMNRNFYNHGKPIRIGATLSFAM